MNSLIIGSLDLPEPITLPGTDKTLSPFIIADAAFPLRNDLMKPFSAQQLTKEQRIYNYRF
jgi:hypothetical protein